MSYVYCIDEYLNTAISHDAPGFKKLARAYVTEMVISGKTLVMIRDNAIWDIYSMDMPLISNKAKFDFALKTAILNVVQERLVILSTAHGGVFGLAEATLLESLPEEGKADNGTNKGVKDDEVLDLITFE